MSNLPPIIVTGASGIVGRRFLDLAKESYTLLALARRSQSQSEVPAHPNIRWIQVDIANWTALKAVMGRIRELGGADYILHLAAYYDFDCVPHPEYTRTNVHGTRHMLELANGRIETVADAGIRSQLALLMEKELGYRRAFENLKSEVLADPAAERRHRPAARGACGGPGEAGGGGRSCLHARLAARARSALWPTCSTLPERRADSTGSLRPDLAGNPPPSGWQGKA